MQISKEYIEPGVFSTSCHAWVGRCKNPHEFKHWTRSPSHNPGRGTRHSTLEEAVQWAKNWIDMRERLIEMEARIARLYSQEEENKRYELALGNYKRGEGPEPQPFKFWRFDMSRADRSRAGYQDYLDSLLTEQKAATMAFGTYEC